MEPDLEPDIRQLAYHLWQTAGREFGQTALDFWAMAERMVVELTADSVRRANTATAAAIENAANWPAALRALYRYRVRDLARGMWAASTEQRDRSLDYWLAAEQHLRLLAEAAARGRHRRDQGVHGDRALPSSHHRLGSNPGRFFTSITSSPTASTRNPAFSA